MKIKNIAFILDKYWYLSLGIIIVVHLFILIHIIFFPYPELFIYSYLTKAGMVPYKQIFDQHFPGIMFFPINLATLGIDTVAKMRIMHLLVVALTQVLLFITAKKLFKSVNLALFASLIFIPWQIYLEGYVLWIDTFIPLFLLPAFFLLLDKFNVKKHFLSGLLLGFALLFKQITLPLIFLICLYSVLKYKSISKSGPILLGLLIPVSLLIFWISSLGIWHEFFYWTISFNLGPFAQMGRKVITFPQLIKIIPVIGLGFVSLLTLASQSLKKSVLLVIFTLGSLTFVIARFDFVHLQPLLPFSVLLIVSLVVKILNRYKFLVLFSYFLVSSLFISRSLLGLVGSRTLFFTENEINISREVAKFSEPGASVFSVGTIPHINQLTKTLPPDQTFVFQFPWFMKVAGERIYDSLILDRPTVIVLDRTTTVSNIKVTEFMPKIIGFADRYYQVVEKIGNTEIMVKR